jgi:hypothetical protein
MLLSDEVVEKPGKKQKAEKMKTMLLKEAIRNARSSEIKTNNNNNSDANVTDKKGNNAAS